MICSIDDKKIFNRVIKLILKKEFLKESPGKTALEIGRFFLGKPYKVNPYNVSRGESFIINLREFDCFSFVENVVGLVCLFKTGDYSFKSFCKLLKRIHYRSGKMNGYASRLHYFSDWIYDNEKKGFLKNVTMGIGGRRLKKMINFMTQHRELYPQLKDFKNFKEMREIERKISRRSILFIPKEGFKKIEKKIREGDIIGVTTNEKGLDVKHVGIAVRSKGRIHLLHASYKEGKVIFSRESLYSYLMSNKKRSGIMVARIY